MSSSEFACVLPPVLTIASAEAICEQWQTISAPIAVNPSELEQIDLAGLQLIIALRPHSLSGSSSVLDAALARAGLDRADIVMKRNPEIGLCPAS